MTGGRRDRKFPCENDLWGPGARHPPEITADNLVVPRNLRHLYAYLLENRSIEGLRGFEEGYLPFFSGDIFAKIGARDPAWEVVVPPQVAAMIKERGLWGTPPG